MKSKTLFIVFLKTTEQEVDNKFLKMLCIEFTKIRLILQ